VEHITERQTHLEDPKTLSAAHRPDSALLETHHQTSDPRQASEETFNEQSE
jgi:hypothetical protein